MNQKNEAFAEAEKMPNRRREERKERENLETEWMIVYLCVQCITNSAFSEKQSPISPENQEHIQYESSLGTDSAQPVTKLFCFGSLRIFAIENIYGLIVEIGCAYNLYVLVGYQAEKRQRPINSSWDYKCGRCL